MCAHSNVGADDSVRPQNAALFRQIRNILWLTELSAPKLARERPGLPRQCENQIMLGCQQSGVSRPIMVTMVGATLARP